MKTLVALSLTLMLGPIGTVAFAQDQEKEPNDEYTLQLKGFSQEMVAPAEAQISRMEGRYPSAPPSKGKQVWANFVNGDWTGTNQPFGYGEVAPPRYQPK